jgi:hypothetical protein
MPRNRRNQKNRPCPSKGYVHSSPQKSWSTLSTNNTAISAIDGFLSAAILYKLSPLPPQKLRRLQPRGHKRLSLDLLSPLTQPLDFFVNALLSISPKSDEAVGAACTTFCFSRNLRVSSSSFCTSSTPYESEILRSSRSRLRISTCRLSPTLMAAFLSAAILGSAKSPVTPGARSMKKPNLTLLETVPVTWVPTEKFSATLLQGSSAISLRVQETERLVESIPLIVT